MKHALRTLIVSLAVLAVLIAPAVTHAQVITNIWEGTSCQGAAGSGPTDPCSFCDALIVTSNIIQFLFQIAFLLTTLMIVWGAIRLMIAGGDSSAVESAKKTITSAVWGLVIALASWIIIGTFLSLLGGEGVDFTWYELTCTP